MQERTDFAIWLAGALTGKRLKQQDLARACGVSASYITKILNTKFVPDEEKVRAIGKALEDPLGALQAAGYAPSFPQLPVSSNAVRLLHAFMEWLVLEGIYTRAQSDFLLDCFEESLRQYDMLKALRQELIFPLFNSFGLALRDLMSARDVASTAMDPISQEVQTFIRNMPTIQFPLKQHNNELLLPALLSGMFTSEEDLLHLQLNIPLLLIPIALLRITGKPDWLSEEKKRVLEIKRFEEDEIEKTLQDTHNRFLGLPERERRAILSLAKSLVNSLADLLDLRFDLLRTSSAYYDIKHIYAPEQDVFVFSTTSGLVVPQEFYGDISKKKNTYRPSYFLDGILHGLRSGCRVHYQFSISSTSEELKKGRNKASNKSEFEEAAAGILADFIMEPNLEITSVKSLEADPRFWFTVSSRQWVAVTARDRTSKKLVHGLLFDSLYFNMLLDMVSAPQVTELAAQLNQQDKTRTVIKPMGASMDHEEAMRQAMKIVRELLSK